ncbi:GNAT family N-acetyltransferase [Paenibacillus tritici]|uniref:GNAT family N-acetyltransferase n=2 Tax=Paenibacillus tritici TaxID=1873425 RepID=A0ABX2DRH1_9BACL|nr:GNAT family protein [Paenibacillus tritici]NQX47274.1 GNAT family N-acetyltransferase [Paenibacillus tritici]
MKIRSLQSKDAAFILEWMRDPSVNIFFRMNPNTANINSIHSFIEKSNKDKVNKHLAIVDESDEYLGTVSLKNIDVEAGTGEYAIVLRSSSQGIGAGRFGTESILSIGFKELKLNRIYLNVLSENHNAIGFYDRIGFVFEGEFINHIKVNGNLKNLKWYRMMRCEYDNRKLQNDHI